MQLDASTEFKGDFHKLFRAKNVELITSVPGVYRSQGIVQRFNRTLAERLFGHQYAQEILNPQERIVQWVERLPRVVKALNEETTTLIQTEDGGNIAPARAIKLLRVKQPPHRLSRLPRPQRSHPTPSCVICTNRVNKSVGQRGEPPIPCGASTRIKSSRERVSLTKR